VATSEDANKDEPQQPALDIPKVDAEKVEQSLEKVIDGGAVTEVSKTQDLAVETEVKEKAGKVSEKPDDLEKAYFKTVSGEDEGDKSNEAKSETVVLSNPEEIPVQDQKKAQQPDTATAEVTNPEAVVEN